MALPTRQPSRPERAIVSEARHDPAERQRTLAEDRAAGMVLEADDRPPVSGIELALDQHVADETQVPGHGVQREDAGAGLLAARAVAVVAAEQLISAADGEHDGAGRHRLRQQPRRAPRDRVR